LEARIIPKRIEHGIEPEQRGSQGEVCAKGFALLFRRERGGDFFEARALIGSLGSLLRQS
jgi:hypothetical protein